MDLALGAVGSLLPKLDELLKDEYAKQKGLKPAIESLCRELVMMEAALDNMSRTAPSDQLNEVDKCWARLVRELWYDMEDAVDAFMVRVAGPKPANDATDGNVFKKITSKASTLMSKFKERHQIAERIKNIKNLSQELSELHAKYNKISSTAPNVDNGFDPRVLNLYKDETELVGMEKARDDLIRMLTVEGGDESSDLSLKRVSIVGFGGLGKTALARTAHDRLKEKYFDCWAFISVGRNPNIEMIFTRMLHELDNGTYRDLNMSGWDADLFIKELHKFLNKKRYFIVVDDIWDKKSWELISYALRDTKCGSRIIITSRNYDAVSKVSNVYKLQPLSSGKSKELFYKRICPREQECLDNQPDEVLEKIMDKCGGVPLAIIALASLLAGRPWEDWSKVYDSIVSEHEDKTMTILAYSYHDLPSYLKPCLLILSIFPEDYGFDKNSFIWLWMSEGFVKEKDGENPFEIGERYFNELLNRCMIQPIQSNADRSIVGYSVHDIVLDLIRELSMEENFLTVLRNKRQHSSLDSAKIINGVTFPGYDRKVRRLAIQDFHAAHIIEDNVGITDGVRSLVITDNVTQMMPPICSFEACRVLDIVNCKYPDLKHLGKLRQLRFLVIYNTPVNELPKSIRKLKCLQTLCLTYIGLDELPAEVCDLTKLMFMEAVGFERVPANRMGNLVSLEELLLDPLIGRSETEDFVVQLGKLKRLRVLRVTFYEELQESSQEALVKSLCSLMEIKDIQLKGSGKSKAVTAWEIWKPPRQLWRLYIECISFSRMPVWINPSCLGRLCYLSLSVDAVEPKDIDNLGKLQELLYLELRGRHIHQGCTIAAEAFKNLRVCRVDTAFKFLQGAMPKIEFLSLKFSIAKGAQDEDFRASYAIPNHDLGLGNLLTLEKIIFSFDCSDAHPVDVRKAVSLVKCAVKHHPRNPKIRFQGSEPLSQDVKHIICVVREEQDGNYNFQDFFCFYLGVIEVNVDVDCEGARLCKVEKVEAAWRKAAMVYWPHPTLKLKRINADKMDASSDHSDPEGDLDDSADNNITT